MRWTTLAITTIVVTATLVLSVPFVSENVKGSILYVGGTGPSNFTSIQDAINVSIPGGTVHVYPGTYQENIVIDKSLNVIGESKESTVIDGRGLSDVVHIATSWVNMTNFTVTNSWWGFDNAGMRLDSVHDCLVTNINISNSYHGVVLEYSDQNTISGNEYTNNSITGISIRFSGNNTFSNNSIFGGVGGLADIYVDYSHGNTFSHNNLSITGAGIMLRDSENNTISMNVATSNSISAFYVDRSNYTGIFDNIITDSGLGVYLRQSERCTVIRNNLTRSGVMVSGENIGQWNTHGIDTSNSVNGKPLQYWQNATAGTVPFGAGQVILANCTNVSVENQNIANSPWGIALGFSNNNSLIGNNASSNNVGGISVRYSSYITLANNTASFNGWDGIELEHSDHNELTNNTLSGNGQMGLSVQQSDFNYIRGNMIFHNEYYGLDFTSSDGNSIFHNNIMSNENQARDYGTNSWDGGYPSGGNYWGDYDGVDQKSGIDQDQPGADGIGDTPYDIDAGSNTDRYPLVDPVAPPPEYPPTAPQNPLASPGDQEVTLTWDPPAFNGGMPVTNYRIHRGTSPGGLALLVDVGNVNSYLDAGLTNGQTYYYQVSALNAIGEGLLSEEVNATPATLPGSPVNLTVNFGDAYVNLTWDPPSYDGGSPVSNYSVYRGLSPGSGIFRAETSGNQHLNDTGVSNGVTYYYEVAAWNAVGEGPPSGEVMATPATVPSPPLAPVTTTGDGFVNISWSPPTSDGGSPITNYSVYRGASSGSEVFLSRIGNVTHFVDTDVVNGNTYFYVVGAENSIGEGPLSAEVSATPENNPPTCIIQSPLTGEQVSGTILISGSSIDIDGTIQIVEIRFDNGSWTAAAGTTSWSFEWDTSDVSDGPHTIHVRSFDGSNYSSEVIVNVNVDNAPPSKPIYEELWVWILVAFVLFVVVAATFLVLRRRRTSGAEQNEVDAEEQDLDTEESESSQEDDV